jgi:predicted transposase/invertase (TIGR01784 family)
MLKDRYINPFTDISKINFDDELSLKYYRDLTNVTNTAFQDGEKKGKEEGREEGREEGVKQRNIEIVLTALNENVPIPMITLLTGLTEEEILQIKVHAQKS